MLIFLLFTAAHIVFVMYLVCFILEKTGHIDKKNPENWSSVPNCFLNFLTDIVTGLFRFEVINEAGDLSGKKVIFVCNHQLGSMEVPILFTAIYQKFSIYPRGLADRFHYRIPIHSHFLTLMGGVPGERGICSQAMNNDIPLLVFPGGSNEVLRTSTTPRYSLQWGDRSGFARLAIQHGYTIVPVSSIGADEQFLILFEFPISWVFKLFGDSRAKKTQYLPIIFPNFNFQKQYVKIHKPIETALLSKGNPEEILRVRDQTRDVMNEGFECLKRIQKGDTNRFGFFSPRV